MDENEKDLEKKEVKKEETKKPSEARKERRSIKTIFGIYKGEFDKIIWPTRQDLIKQTFTVIVTSLMVGAIIAAMDYGLRFAYDTMLRLVS